MILSGSCSCCGFTFFPHLFLALCALKSSRVVPLMSVTATWETTLENRPLLVQVRLNDQ